MSTERLEDISAEDASVFKVALKGRLREVRNLTFADQTAREWRIVCGALPSILPLKTVGPVALTKSERPDFLLWTEGRATAIEVTEVVSQLLAEASAKIDRDKTVTAYGTSDLYMDRGGVAQDKFLRGKPRKAAIKAAIACAVDGEDDGMLGDEPERRLAELIKARIAAKSDTMAKFEGKETFRKTVLVLGDWMTPPGTCRHEAVELVRASTTLPKALDEVWLVTNSVEHPCPRVFPCPSGTASSPPARSSPIPLAER